MTDPSIFAGLNPAKTQPFALCLSGRRSLLGTPTYNPPVTHTRICTRAHARTHTHTHSERERERASNIEVRECWAAYLVAAGREIVGTGEYTLTMVTPKGQGPLLRAAPLTPHCLSLPRLRSPNKPGQGPSPLRLPLGMHW